MLKNEKDAYSIYTQDSIGFGREVNYEALYRNLHLMRNQLNNNVNTILGLPFEMSSGLAEEVGKSYLYDQLYLRIRCNLFQNIYRKIRRVIFICCHIYDLWQH